MMVDWEKQLKKERRISLMQKSGRLGMGKGQGKGYKNITPPDPNVHSMSARGIKQQQQIAPLIPRLTIADARRINKEKGFHFFDAESMRFFSSTIESNLFEGDYFITSEEKGFKASEGRAYTVRKFNRKTGAIEEAGDSEFLQFSTKDQARDFIRDIQTKPRARKPTGYREQSLSYDATPDSVKAKKKFFTPTQVVNLEMELQKKKGINYEDLKEGTYWQLSISGDLSTKTEGRPRQDSFGQMLESIEKPNYKLRKIRDIWKKYHLNDLTAGTKRQEDALAQWKQRPKGWSYDEDVAFLKSKKLYTDNGYNYGSKWLMRPIPDKVRHEIALLFK